VQIFKIGEFVSTTIGQGGLDYHIPKNYRPKASLHFLLPPVKMSHTQIVFLWSTAHSMIVHQLYSTLHRNRLSQQQLCL